MPFFKPNASASSSTVPSLAVTSKSATYTALTTDDVILCDASGGSFDIDLPTAVGNIGKVFYIKRTDQTLANKVTIDPNSTETIDGFNDRGLYTKNEMLVIVSNGTNWNIIERFIDKTPESYTPTINGVTKTNESHEWYRDGAYIVVTGKYETTAVSANPLRINMPTNLSIDSTSQYKIVGWHTTQRSSASAAINMVNLFVNTGITTYVSSSNVGNGAGGILNLAEINADTQLGETSSQAYYFRLRVSGWEG